MSHILAEILIFWFTAIRFPIDIILLNPISNWNIRSDQCFRFMNFQGQMSGQYWPSSGNVVAQWHAILLIRNYILARIFATSHRRDMWLAPLCSKWTSGSTLTLHFRIPASGWPMVSCYLTESSISSSMLVSWCVHGCVCYLTESTISSSMLVSWWFCLFVCLYVCQPSSGHSFALINSVFTQVKDVRPE